MLPITGKCADRTVQPLLCFCTVNHTCELVWENYTITQPNTSKQYLCLYTAIVRRTPLIYGWHFQISCPTATIRSVWKPIYALSSSQHTHCQQDMTNWAEHIAEISCDNARPLVCTVPPHLPWWRCSLQKALRQSTACNIIILSLHTVFL